MDISSTPSAEQHFLSGNASKANSSIEIINMDFPGAEISSVRGSKSSRKEEEVEGIEDNEKSYPLTEKEPNFLHFPKFHSDKFIDALSKDNPILRPISSRGQDGKI